MPWYFEWEGKTFGPYSGVQFKQLAAVGRLQPTDMVWKVGATTRVPAAQIRGLFAARGNQAVPAKPANDAPAPTPPKPTNDAPASTPALPTRKLAEREGSSRTKKLSLMPGVTDYQPPPEEEMRGLIPDPDSVALVPVVEEKPRRAADDEDDMELVGESTTPPSRSRHASPSRSRHTAASRSRHASPSRSRHASPPPSKSKHVSPPASRSRHAGAKPKNCVGERSTPKDSTRHRTTKHGGKGGAGPRK